MNYHGGDIYDIVNNVIDYSSNINPFGVPISFRESLINGIERFTQYPDIKYLSLKKNIREYLNVNICNIVAGNGAVDIIYRLVASCGCKNMLIAAPAFSEYRGAANAASINYKEEVCYNFKNDTFDVDKIYKSVNLNNTLVTICNPNNPTGGIIQKDKLIWLCKKLNDINCMLMVDEAFIEFTDNFTEFTMLSEIDKFKNLFIIRAATKFFGMPGIRLGYGMSGNREIIKNMEKFTEPWSINTSAVIASEVIYKDYEYINKSREWIKEERHNMYTAFSSIEGLHVHKSYCNFHLLQIIKENITAEELKQKMITYGFLIRTAEGFEGLDEKFIRLAVKDKANNEKIIKALEVCL